VFGHEIGHIRHQHMLCYLVFLLVSMVGLGLVTTYYLLPLLAQAVLSLAEWLPWVPPSLAARLASNGDLQLVPLVPLLLAYIFVVFGYLSRRCERQADVFGCRAVSCLDPACDGHGAEPRLSPRGRGLCPTGIGTFIRALEKVALVNGISPDRPGFLQSWQHSTIAKRVAFLRRVLAEPSVETAFQRRLRLVKAGLFVGLGILVTGLVYLHGWP
jgi:STE24 endopeptidase